MHECTQVHKDDGKNNVIDHTFLYWKQLTFWVKVNAQVHNGEKGNSIDYTSLVLEAMKVVHLLNISDEEVVKKQY